METDMTVWKIDSQWEYAGCLRELKQGLCDNLEGRDGEGSSRGRGHGCPYGCFLLMFDRKRQNTCKSKYPSINK